MEFGIILLVGNTIADNWEPIVTALLAIAAATPTPKDDSVVQRVGNLGRKFLGVFKLFRR